MSRKKYSPEQIIIHLREVNLLCSQGNNIAEAVRQIGVTEHTYYRWRKQYEGMTVTDAEKLKELEKENARLKKLVADLSLDNAILKDMGLRTGSQSAPKAAQET
jgi:putative transposase